MQVRETSGEAVNPPGVIRSISPAMVIDPQPLSIHGQRRPVIGGDVRSPPNTIRSSQPTMVIISQGLIMSKGPRVSAVGNNTAGGSATEPSAVVIRTDACR